MQELDYQKFAEAFFSKAVPLIRPIEDERLKVVSKMKILNVLMGIVIIAGVIISLLYWNGIIRIASSDDAIGIIQLIVFLCVLIGFGKQSLKKGLQRKFKDKLYTTVFQEFGLKYVNTKQAFYEAEKNIRYICDESAIFDRYDNIKVDDIIEGEYKGLPFKIYDAYIYYVVRTRKSSYTVTVFRGAFLAIKVNKNLKAETLIISDRKMNPRTIKDKANVKLEDVEFEKLFEVYSTDQIEARYLLTTAFLDRITQFVKQKKYPVEVLFSTKTYFTENSFFFFDTRHDHFEVPIDKSLLEKNMLYNVLLEIAEFLNIVDALKLDQNIGL